MHRNFTGLYVNKRDPSYKREYDASYEVTAGQAKWSAVVRSDGTTFRGNTSVPGAESDAEKLVALAIGGAIDARLDEGAG